MRFQVQEKVAHVGAAVREHVTPDSHSATTAPSSRAGGTAVQWPLFVIVTLHLAETRTSTGTVQDCVLQGAPLRLQVFQQQSSSMAQSCVSVQDE